MTLSLTDSLTKDFTNWHYRVTLETCDLWDIWSEWWGNMTWPKLTIIFKVGFNHLQRFVSFFSKRRTFFSERMPSCFAKFIQTIWMQILILLWWHFQMQRPNDQMTISCLKKYSYGEVLNIEICFHFSHLDSLQIDRKLCFPSIYLTLWSPPSPLPSTT